jgi:hypothetical protein
MRDGNPDLTNKEDEREKKMFQVLRTSVKNRDWGEGYIGHRSHPHQPGGPFRVDLATASYNIS